MVIPPKFDSLEIGAKISGDILVHITQNVKTNISNSRGFCPMQK